MAIFDPKSRYAKPAPETYAAVDVRGRRVQALPVPEPPLEIAVAAHVQREGQRLDQVAGGYLRDPNGYWRIAELNDAMLPDALAELEQVKIPSPTR
jgi:hypothetical protein